VPIVNAGEQGDLLQRIALMRKQLALDLGIVIPSVRIRDNIQLPASGYVIKLRGIKVAAGEVLAHHLLAIDASGSGATMDGVRTSDPSFGMPAAWIRPDRRLDAESRGLTVVDPQVVLSTHLMETMRRHASELLTRQGVRELMDGLKEANPALVDDVTAKLSLGIVHRVLQRLLREGIPIRDLMVILEALSDAGDQIKDPEPLTEHVRRALAPMIANLFAERDGTIRGITVGPKLEASLMTLFSTRQTRESVRSLEPDDVAAALRTLTQLAASTKRDGRFRPLIAPAALRVGIRRLIDPVLPQLSVLSLGELPPQTPIASVGLWELNRAG
jgi:flagellar biosynthesis protein FlhA